MKRQKKNRFTIPYYKEGGSKSDWISNKIGILIGEGYPKDQAAAIAYSMYENRNHMQDGGKIEDKGIQLLNQSVTGNTFQFDTPLNTKTTSPSMQSKRQDYGSEIIKPVVYVSRGVNPETNSEGYNVYYGDPNNPQSDKVFFTNDEFEMKKNYRASSQNPSYNREPHLMKYLDKTKGRINQLVHYNDGGEYIPMYQNGASFNNPFTQMQLDNVGNPIGSQPITVPTNMTNPTTGEFYGVGKDKNYVNALDTKNPMYSQTSVDFGNAHNVQKDLQNNTNPSPQLNYQDPYQFYNPYGGVDIPTAANYLGQSIGEGNTLGTVLGGLKVATGLGRNIFAGIGNQKRKQEALKNYNEKKRDNLTGNFQPLYEEQRVAGYSFQNGGQAGYYPQLDPKMYEETPQVESQAYQPTQDEIIAQNQQITENNPQFSNLPPVRDRNSARDMWEEKTGLSWSEAKRLGYTDGTAKDNIKLLSELSDSRFDKNKLRKEPLKKQKVVAENVQAAAPVTNEIDDSIYDSIITQGGKYFNSVRWKSLMNIAGTTGANVDQLSKKDQKEFLTALKASEDFNKRQRVTEYFSSPQAKAAATFAAQTGQPIKEHAAMLKEADEVNAFNDRLNKLRGEYNKKNNPVKKIGTVPTVFSYQEGGEMPVEGQEMQQNPQGQQEQMMQQIAQALQGGADPQEVLNQLVQMGVPQDQAQQLIQGIMQQMQGAPEQQPMMQNGGTYLETLKGKKITDYKFNPETNSYEVIYE